MKYAVAALLSSSAAIQLRTAPDVYGPNGDNYTNESANYDLSRIGINVHAKGHGPQCTAGDWAVVHFKGTLTDGRVVTDSHSQGWGNPLTFTIGSSDAPKCFDLAVPQLHAGDHATLSCPSYYAWGGAYTMSPLGGEPIPLHSDVNYEVEVMDCARHPEDLATDEIHHQPHTTTMQPDTCFYLHSHTGEHEAINQVLTTRLEGGKQVLAVEHKVVDETEQQWFWDIKDGSLRNQAHPDLRVDWTDGVKGLFLSPKGGAHQGGFDYTLNDQVFAGNHNPLTINHDDYTVHTAGNYGENGQFWHIEYCYNFVPKYVSEDGLGH